MKDNSTKLIVALDQPDLPKAEALASELASSAEAFKVGLTLWNAYGPRAFEELAVSGKIFCDLKLHDIPQQVGGAAAELARLGVWMFTVHASGGRAMVEAAVEAARSVNTPPIVAAVTVLTSLSAKDLVEVGQGNSAEDQVLRLAELALNAGANALVCSPHEIAAVRKQFGDSFELVVPGIRPVGTDPGDQSRVMTPQQAARAGADYIVVGRAITQAPDPVDTAIRINQELIK